jgi:hypothetical protein
MQTYEESVESGGKCIITTYCIGYILAMVIRWSRSMSIHLALYHGALSWGYVLWFAIKTGRL